MDPPRTNPEKGQGSTRNDGTNPSCEPMMAKMIGLLERQENRIVQLEDKLERVEREEDWLEKNVDNDDVAMIRFLKFNPPIFGGTGNEEDAEIWLERMEKIYAPLHYSEERKIQFGVYQLEGPAEAWWRVIEQKWEQVGAPRTWKSFQDEFTAKFIPQVIRDKREEEFLYLRQRAWTVSQYEVVFTRLAKYAPELVNTDEKRKRKFIRGLNMEIQHALIIARVTSYAEAVEFAQRIEDNLARLREFQSKQKTTIRNLPTIGGDKRLVTAGKRLEEKKGTSSDRCRWCRRTNHAEDKCWKKTGQCLRCGNTDHLVRSCPLQATRPSSITSEPGALTSAKRPKN